jgi:hypothetical protein
MVVGWLTMENAKQVITDSVASDPARKLKLIDGMAVSGGIADFLKSAESGMSDLARQLKLMDSMASDPARKFMDSMAVSGGIADFLKSAESGMSDLARQLKLIDGISDELRRSLEHTAQLSRSVDQSLSNIHISTPASWFHEDFELPPSQHPNQTLSGELTVTFLN